MPIYILWPSLWGLLWSCLDFNSFQINAVSSVSLTSAIVSSIAVYQYKWAVSRVVVSNLYSSNTFLWEETHFADKNATLKLDDQENTSVAISSLIAIVSTVEVVFAVCAAWSSDSLYQPTQENQVSQVCDISYGATRNKFNTMAQKISQSEYKALLTRWYYTEIFHCVLRMCRTACVDQYLLYQLVIVTGPRGEQFRE